MARRQKYPGQRRALNLHYQGKNVIFTFDIDDTNFSKEVSITENSKLCDPIICHHCKLPFFNDVHFVSYISFFADIFPWTEYLQGKRCEDIACLYFTFRNEALSALLFIAAISTGVQTNIIRCHQQMKSADLGCEFKHQLLQQTSVTVMEDSHLGERGEMNTNSNLCPQV